MRPPKSLIARVIGRLPTRAPRTAYVGAWPAGLPGLVHVCETIGLPSRPLEPAERYVAVFPSSMNAGPLSVTVTAADPDAVHGELRHVGEVGSPKLLVDGEPHELDVRLAGRR